MNRQKARKEKFGRGIRIMWKRFSDYLSDGAAIKAKFRTANFFQLKLSTKRFAGNLLVTFCSLLFTIERYFPNPN